MQKSRKMRKIMSQTQRNKDALEKTPHSDATAEIDAETLPPNGKWTSFVRGALSAFDFLGGGSRTPPVDPSRSVAEAEAIRQGWECVGDAMRGAMRAYSTGGY